MKIKKRRMPKVSPNYPKPSAGSDFDLIDYIRKFDKANDLKRGTVYIIGGREVVI
jgi:hypothetical protein